MRTASVSELKARLAQYLRLARRGSEVQILERGVPIARLVSCAGQAARRDKDRLEHLAREGILRQGVAALDWLVSEPPLVVQGAQLTEAVVDEREDRI
jgi:prevent-host-death family protein